MLIGLGIVIIATIIILSFSLCKAAGKEDDFYITIQNKKKKS